jgi:hypothetical protein
MWSYLAKAWMFLVVLAAVGLAVYGRAEERARRVVETHEPPAAAKEAPRPEPSESASGAPAEGRTLPVSEAASEADGLLELRVTSGGLPVSRAQVRLYRREGRVPDTGRVDWRVAGAGATGNDGRLLMPALAGSYLLVARADGLAPAWLNLMHPLGVPRTPVGLRLEEPTSFTGRTVLQSSGKPLQGAELTLTPDMSAWDSSERADAPAEERVTVMSDAVGRFHVEGLAPGIYTVEGRAPGAALPVEWTIHLPLAEPQVLALPQPGGFLRMKRLQRPASMERGGGPL